MANGGENLHLHWNSSDKSVMEMYLYVILEEGFSHDKNGTIDCLTAVEDVEIVTGVLNFATSSASKVYINLNIDYMLALADRFANVCPRLHLGVSSGKVKKTVEEEMFENQMNIQQLLQGEWNNKPKVFDPDHVLEKEYKPVDPTTFE
ncbi:hypothetical protein Ccrd_008738 [Cynara cardunculus var. scolymus]|uniref:Uncharacterized protein n=1 Tax=Cynara cardunculus var. scolymus TaxID=59895 RepID=A0A118JSJ2_CYNCS|nr:hypothetical protein Ccrd_008738 [Cynara cardunculus var. scolymus]